MKIPGAVKWLDIHLRRGLVDNKLELWDWRQLVVSGKVGKARKSGDIMLVGERDVPIAKWHFVNAWPSRIEDPIPAADNDRVALEEIVLVHEGITRQPLTPPA
jgi:phage tail-like protein